MNSPFEPWRDEYAARTTRGSKHHSRATVHATRKSGARERYKSLYYWNEVPKGGHFAAMEQPALFVAEMRSALRQFR